MTDSQQKKLLQLISPHLNNPHSTHIHDLHSHKARNLLRGINDPTDYSSTKKTLHKIRQNCNYQEYKKSVTFIRTNPLFEQNCIGQLFNQQCPKGLPDTVLYTINEINQQITHHANCLISLSVIARGILLSLKENDLNTAIDLCSDLSEAKGTSVFLIKMISFITNRYQVFKMDDEELIKKIDCLKRKINLFRASFIEETVTQLSNLRTAHISIHKRISELDGDVPYIHIAKSFINPIPKDKDTFLKQMNSFYSFSLFDAFLFIQNTNSLELPFQSTIQLSSPELLDAFNKISEIEFSPECMYESLSEHLGYYYLRECFLFPEQPKALKYQIIHGKYYSEGKLSRSPTGFAKKLIDEYFNDVTKLTDLRATNMNNDQIDWSKYDRNNCGMLENSSALIHLLNKKEGVIEKTEEKLFVELMSFTQDIGEICNTEHLEVIAESATDFILKLVIRCLISINNKKQYAEYELRSVIQEYCISEFDGDLNKLIKHLFSISPAVTEHLMLTCNETFLSTLFHLMEKPVDALEVRANMLHWFGEETGQERYLDRAKTLRIDIQLNKEKDTIDDSRIYVDPIKYSQWFEDNMVSKLTMALDSLMISNKKIVIDWDKKSSGIGNADAVIDYLLSCYSEFCNNNLFGIASYLGRRIRHGTFKGTAITEVSTLAKKEEYFDLFIDKDFKTKFDFWLENYQKMIEELIKNSLQIKSRKKPNGVITANIDSHAKNQHATQLIYEILNIYSSRTGVARLPIIIMDCCWRLVEHDLIRIKKLLSEKKSSHAVFSYSAKNVDPVRRREYSRFCRELNSVTNEKFRLISSWFNKPSYASPSTEIYLLFRAVVSEVKGSVSHFTPKIDLGNRSFSIVGGTYYVIYDALYVLIHNAAIHGKPNGHIYFNISKPEKRNALKINLITELSLLCDLKEATKNIDQALAESDDNAHVVEGNSGIKKLKRMEKDGSISGLTFTPNERDLQLDFEFYFEFDSKGKYDDFDS